MGRINATFDGRIVAEPDYFQTASGANGVNFPVYVNRQRKDRDTGEYNDTGDTSKIRVTLWGDLVDSVHVVKGDIVEVVASIYEREYEGKNGPGRSLETDYVESVTVKFHPDGDKPKATAGATNAWSGDSEPVW